MRRRRKTEVEEKIGPDKNQRQVLRMRGRRRRMENREEK